MYETVIKQSIELDNYFLKDIVVKISVIGCRDYKYNAVILCLVGFDCTVQ